MRTKFVKNIYQSILLYICMGGAFLCSFVFCACDLFNVPIKPFFEENTSTAQIVRYTFSEEYPSDSESKLSIPSSKDCTITFDLINPKQFGITPTIQFTDKDVQEIYKANDGGINITQTEDKNKISLTFKKDFLVATEHGKNLDATILLNEKETGRSFPSYEISNIRSNSKPPEVQNLTVMQSDGKFVLCFNMPVLKDTVHQEDTTTLVIKTQNNLVNKTYTFNSSASSANELNFSGEGISSITTIQPSNLISSSTQYETFTHTSNSVYFYTGINVNNQTFQTSSAGLSNQTFLVYLLDQKELNQIQKVGSSLAKLDKPQFDFGNDSPSTLVEFDQDPDSDGTKKIKINVQRTSFNDVQNFDVTEPIKISYQITRDGKTFTEEIETTETEVYIKLHPGQSVLTVKQTSPLYFDSLAEQRTVNVTTRDVWVDANSTAQYEYGSKDYPYKTLASAANVFTKITADNTINIVNMDSSTEDVTFTMEMGNITIQSADNNKKTINRTLIFGEGEEITFKNLNIEKPANSQNGYQNNSCYPNLQFSMYDCNIYSDFYAGISLAIYSTVNIAAGKTIAIANMSDNHTIFLQSGVNVIGSGKIKLNIKNESNNVVTLASGSNKDDIQNFEIDKINNVQVIGKELYETTSGTSGTSKNMKVRDIVDTADVYLTLERAENPTFNINIVNAKNAQGEEVPLSKMGTITYDVEVTNESNVSVFSEEGLTTSSYTSSQKFTSGTLYNVTVSAKIFGKTYTNNSYNGVDLSAAYKVGDIITKDGGCIPYMEGHTLTDAEKDIAAAIIFRATNGLQKALGVALNRVYDDWAKSGTTGADKDFGIGATYNTTTQIFTGDGATDGSTNWEKMQTSDPTGTANAATNYPLFYKAINYGSDNDMTGSLASGWYVPSIQEFYDLYKQKTTNNDFKALWTQLRPNNDQDVGVCHTSTQYDATQTRTVEFNGETFNSDDKRPRAQQNATLPVHKF